MFLTVTNVTSKTFRKRKLKLTAKKLTPTNVKTKRNKIKLLQTSSIVVILSYNRELSIEFKKNWEKVYEVELTSKIQKWTLLSNLQNRVKFFSRKKAKVSNNSDKYCCKSVVKLRLLHSVKYCRIFFFYCNLCRGKYKFNSTLGSQLTQLYSFKWFLPKFKF